jgi:hypothetical protein
MGKSKGINKKETPSKVEKKASFQPEGNLCRYVRCRLLRGNVTFCLAESSGERNESVKGKITVEHCVS